MSGVGDRLGELAGVTREAEVVHDGGRDYIYIPKLKVLTDGTVREIDALLRPGEHNGYTTRLFLAECLPGKGKGGAWSTYSIGGRTWHTWSWNKVPADLPLAQMLIEHLVALR